MGYALAKVYLRYQPIIYRVNAQLLITNDESNASTLSEEAILADLGVQKDNRNLESEMLIMRSRGLMEKVARKLELEKSFYAVGRVLTTEVYPSRIVEIDSMLLDPSIYGKTFDINIIDTNSFRLLGYGLDQVYPFGEIVITPYGALRFQFLKETAALENKTPLQVSFRNPINIAKSLSRRVQTRAISGTNGVELSMSTPNVNKGIDILNAVIDQYNQDAIENKNTVGKKTLDFIDERLQQLTRELGSVERGVETYKRDRQIIGQEGEGFSNLYGEVQKLEEKLDELEIQKSLLKSVQDYLQQAENNFRTIPSNLLNSEFGINENINTYNLLVFEWQELSQTASESNPSRLEAEKQINFLRQGLQDNIALTLVSMDQQIQQQENRIAAVQTEIRDVPQQERELLEILRQQSIKEELFLYLLKKKDETELSVAVAADNSQLLQTADQNGGPISPDRSRTYLLAIALGLAIPAGISFLADILNDKVTIEEDIKAKTQVHVLGTINFSKKEEQLVIKKGSRSGIAERFRLLRTNLQYLNTDKKENFTILTTSNASGEGKSFISLNLSASLALSEKKVLLIGLDLRKPKLKQYLGFDENTTGMSHYLAGAAEREDIIHKVTHSEHLYFIPSGIVPPNPAEMIMSQKMQTFVEDLKKEFGYIIIDMPPLGLVTDAFLLSEQVDLALFAVRFKKTPKVILARLEELRQSSKFSQLGIVFNGVKAGARYGGYRYGYGYGYGYGDGDGYGYYEES